MIEWICIICLSRFMFRRGVFAPMICTSCDANLIVFLFRSWRFFSTIVCTITYAYLLVRIPGKCGKKVMTGAEK
jgi:hypothetical protein